ncbi:MAG: HAD-IB family phosphatase [Proteobacteria bacterium]|nr:HAD-IB family phosphatase [Candidatus Enterousia scatequi]
MPKRTNVVVFDFDGTLSASDSNFEFVKYCMKKRPYLYAYLPWIALWAAISKFNKAGITWRQQMRHFITKQMVHDYTPGFVSEHKKRRFGWAAEQVKKEHDTGNIVILISASPNYTIPKLVSDMGFDVVLTSQMDSQHPWKYKFLCFGLNKVIALDYWATQNKIIPNIVRAYSDSKSDLPLMKLAKDQVWIDRKTGLRK